MHLKSEIQRALVDISRTKLKKKNLSRIFALVLGRRQADERIPDLAIALS
jgi:hypothetical protein